MANETPAFFGEAARKRIADSVRHYERQIKNSRPVTAGAKHPRVNRPYLGVTDAAIAKGASGTISIYTGTPGSESDSGVNVTAYNRFGAVAITKYVWVDHNGFGWYLTAAEC